MSYTLAEIAKTVGGSVLGDPTIRIERVRSPNEAGAHEIAAVLTPVEAGRVELCRADAILVGSGFTGSHPNQIRSSDSRSSFVALLEMFAGVDSQQGIDPRSFVSDGARIGKDVAIAPGVCIEDGVEIGDRTTIGANTFVGRTSVIGAHCRIMPNVTIYAGSIIGNRVTIHSGTTVGSDGFGYIRLDSGEWRKIPQLGCVEIGDDVEIGANCCIDRATLEKTVIGRGTKIDNLVQVGHNSRIGEDCCIVAQVGIAGSVEVGARCVLGGQAGFVDHVKLGDGVRVGAQAGVNRDLGSGDWIGSPAIPQAVGARVYAALEHFPDYRDRVRALEGKVAKLAGSPDATAEDSEVVSERLGEG